MYDLEVESVVKIIEENRYRAVAVQLPEGLKDRATQLASFIQSETGSMVFIIGDPCYGACDLADDVAETMGCDALLHFGHSKVIGETRIPVHYFEVELDFDPLPLLSKNLKLIPKKVGLVTTVQHIHLLDKIALLLEASGIKVSIGEAKGRIAYRGQVLGCSFSTAKSISKSVEGFLYIGTGDFHPLGVALSTGKKTLALDLERGELRSMDEIKDGILRRRFVQIAKAMDAVEFGIVVGEKGGQRRIKLARKIKKLLEKQNKKGHIICLREINPEVLLPFRGLDAFINTACPRIAIDDATRYKKPFLTPVELEIVLGRRNWEDYQMDEIG
jgi:2-(3-amino-3-carboxypropyl)histidine synthase